jgi:pyridoxal phosphate enzyme (YggS family)
MPATDPDLAARYNAVRDRIAAACARAGRDPAELTLVAVTKSATAATVRALYELGHRDFGENRARELERKRAALPELSAARWHMIGHLQRNKVNKVLPLCHRIHSIDSSRLARAVSDRVRRAGDPPLPVFVEVNVAGEAAKHGLAPDDLPALFRELAGLSGLRVDGLMTMAPWSDDPETARPVFRRLAEFRDTLQARFLSPAMPLSHLSMGMSGDFEVAVEEGATFLRVGTAILGP